MRPLLNPVPLKRRLPAAFMTWLHQPSICRHNDPGNEQWGQGQHGNWVQLALQRLLGLSGLDIIRAQ
jgi:hypothetical protein